MYQDERKASKNVQLIESITSRISRKTLQGAVKDQKLKKI